MSTQFESVYNSRLEALVAGYSYQNLLQEKKEKPISIPTVILKTIERWYSGAIQPKLEINSITSYYAPMYFEIYFDKKVKQLLNVKKYTLRATSVHKSTKDDKEFKTEAKIDNIYDNDYFIAFWTLSDKEHWEYWQNFDFDDREINPFNIKLIALDENNKILCTLKKQIKELYAVTWFMKHLNEVGPYSASRLPKFHLIDHEANDTVHVDQFVASIKKLLALQEDINGELTIKRYFYFLYNNYNLDKFDTELIDYENICQCICDVRRFNENHFVSKFTKTLRTKLGYLCYGQN